MALEVEKKEKESPQNLVRRFTKSVQQSGILNRARKIMFRVREKSRNIKKRAALRREEKRREFEKLKKLGKI
jgi:hypothetical protein